MGSEAGASDDDSERSWSDDENMLFAVEKLSAARLSVRSARFGMGVGRGVGSKRGREQEEVFVPRLRERSGD